MNKISKKTRGRGRTTQNTLRPISLSSNITLGHKYRFVSSSGTATAITPTSLLGAAGTYCYAANSAVQSFFQSVRVNRVQIWAPPASQGSSVTCSLEWVGIANQASNREVSDTSNSVTAPAKVDSRPPRLSLASFWQQPSSTALFTIVAPAGSIIDVTMSLIAQDDNSVAASIAVASGSLAYVYYLSLDPNATHRFTPVSLTTTT